MKDARNSKPAEKIRLFGIGRCFRKNTSAEIHARYFTKGEMSGL
jgi:phenylalanyl-tRNA synthetase alpha subunit